MINHPSVHCITIYNSQDMEATEMSIYREMNKEDVVYIYIYMMEYVLLFSCYVQLFWDSVDCSPLSSTVHRISQERIMVWVAISFSRGSSQPRGQTYISCTGKHVLYH